MTESKLTRISAKSCALLASDFAEICNAYKGYEQELPEKHAIHVDAIARAR